MKKHHIAYVVLPSLLTCTTVSAQPYPWNGFYMGATAGGVASHFQTNSSTQSGVMFDQAAATTINQAGHQTINATGFITGIEGGYNWQYNRWLLGLESDIQALSIDGETYSGALFDANNPDAPNVITSYGNHNWLFTLRPRVGFTKNNWLFYLTGGLALTYLQSDFVYTDTYFFESKRVSKLKAGYDVGAGIEAGLSNHISVKAEYLFANFGTTNASSMNSSVPPGQTFANSVNLKSNILRLGINYHFDQQAVLVPATLLIVPDLLNPCLWETEMGTRLFVSSGTDGSPNPLLNDPGSILMSRLIFSDLTAVSGETFARMDHASGLFAKGYLGAGTLTDGQLNDEDFPGDIAYSNTQSNALGNISYATIDLGYSFFKTPFANTGVFVGYNYNAQNINVYDCQQIANGGVCENPNDLQGFLGISQDDKFNSLRVGLVTQLNLGEGFTLISEAAYLPIVGYRGTDIHDARQLIGPESSNHGDGAMLESVLDYQLNRSWHLGLGARYWMWNMRSGSVTFDFLGQPQTFNEPARYSSQRYGAFLQLDYKDGKPTPVEIWNGTVCWKGIYVGGHLGGAWSKTNWFDPFGTTAAAPGILNIGGFGDYIRAYGPLGGGNINLNWQYNQWVFGLSGNISASDIHGENTLFSGIGGVNGQATTKYIGTITGKLGLTSDAALYYLVGGRAVLNTKYTINANTGALAFGMQSQTTNIWGWVKGLGIEYALTDRWTTNVEYNYISLPSHGLYFSFTNFITGQRIAVRDRMNVYKVGVNYRFDLFG